MSAVIRAVFGYCFLVLMTRIVGRRPGRQMTPFEYVLIFFIGGLVLTTLLGDDRSFANALLVIMTVGCTHFLLAWMKQHSPAFGRIIDGTPLVLLARGEFQSEAMRMAAIEDDDIMAAARDKGLRSLDQIRYAVLERNGEISIIDETEIPEASAGRDSAPPDERRTPADLGADRESVALRSSAKPAR